MAKGLEKRKEVKKPKKEKVKPGVAVAGGKNDVKTSGSKAVKE